MSETATGPDARGPRLEMIIIGLICLVVLSAGWYVLSQQQQSLRRSPAGFDGLQVWLAANGVSAQNFTGGWLMDQTAVGLLLIPLHDTRLDVARPRPVTTEELLRQQDEYDLLTPVITSKARRVPALVVLPKWRSGMRLTGLAHPVLNVETERLEDILEKLTGGTDIAAVSADSPFTDFSYRSPEGEDLTARIYAAQMFTNADCRPVIGQGAAMLLADCPLATDAGPDNQAGSRTENRILVLADPDLLNNHGLRLGDNAQIALDVLGSRAGDRNIVIDYSRDIWLRDPVSEPARERTWDDLARFFGPPFVTLWAGAALVLALFLWRAALRNGPVRPEGSGPGAGKMLAVSARARLMRLSGQDGALIREYATARLAATAASLFGPAYARHYSGEEAFLAYAARRHPEETLRLRAVLAAIRALPARLPAAEAIHQIDQLEQVLEQISHDA
ncbi:hypothetical protein WNZ15_13960 [Roseibium sp. AS2]|uniref:hypothetical protein n=1 Tax=Roseibium sp. AS2 TaxID=3135781 RepID=UPI00317E60D6